MDWKPAPSVPGIAYLVFAQFIEGPLYSRLCSGREDTGQFLLQGGALLVRETDSARQVV